MAKETFQRQSMLFPVRARPRVGRSTQRKVSERSYSDLPTKFGEVLLKRSDKRKHACAISLVEKRRFDPQC